MTYDPDPRVDAYIDALPDWQQAICRELRDLIHATGGHDNKAARMISLYKGDTIKARALTTMLRQIIADNRAGGWRELKARATSS